ncbi:hypothetical protein C0J52_23271, partial [Blattella germanica]
KNKKIKTAPPAIARAATSTPSLLRGWSIPLQASISYIRKMNFADRYAHCIDNKIQFDSRNHCHSSFARWSVKYFGIYVSVWMNFFWLIHNSNKYVEKDYVCQGFTG